MLGCGVLLVALSLGVRHAFDADHIAAIDNVARRFMARGGSRGRGGAAGQVGFFFAMGHSTVVLAMSVLTVLGAKFARPLLADDSPGREVLGFFGSCVSISFLLIVGLMNLKSLIGAARGEQKPVSGFLLRKTELVRRPWHMLLAGFLFGLGFDTATEIALLVLTATTAASGASVWLALAVPLCFAAGMSFFDSLDGWLMGLAYRDVIASRGRARWYNLVFTGFSVLVALGVGLVELASLVRGEELVDSELVGYVVVGVFLALWIPRLVHLMRNRAAASS